MSKGAAAPSITSVTMWIIVPETMKRFPPTTLGHWRVPKTQGYHPAATNWVSTWMQLNKPTLLTHLMMVSAQLKLFTFSYPLDSVFTAYFSSASHFLRTWTFAPSVSSSEVLNPSCSGQLWACGPTGSSHSTAVNTGECQSAGNSQPGSRFKINMWWKVRY